MGVFGSVRDVALSGLAALVLASCSGGGGGGSAPVPPSKPRYNHSADSPPFKKYNSFSDIGVSSKALEPVSFSDPQTNSSYAVQHSKPDTRGGIEFYVFDSGSSSKVTVIATDTRGEYMPWLRETLRPGSNKREFGPINFPLFKIVDIGRKYRDIWVSTHSNDLIQFPPHTLDRTPKGMIYVYYGSFNDLKRDVSMLKKKSAIVALAFPNQATTTAHQIVSTTDDVIEVADQVIDGINWATNSRIKKDLKFHWYAPTPLSAGNTLFGEVPLAIASFVPRKKSAVPISDLLPIQSGNTWVYGRGGKRVATVMSRLEKGVAFGKDFVVVDEPGAKNLLGFKGDELYHFGFVSSEVGSVMFDPPVLLGDDSMSVGRRFHSNAKVVVDRYPQITGEVSSLHTVDSRGNVVTSMYRFGDCFKILENTAVSLRNTDTGKTAYQEARNTRNLARNVGPVTINALELIDMRTVGGALESRVGGSNNIPHSSVDAITSMIKNLVSVKQQR